MGDSKVLSSADNEESNEEQHQRDPIRAELKMVQGFPA